MFILFFSSSSFLEYISLLISIYSFGGERYSFDIAFITKISCEAFDFIWYTIYPGMEESIWIISGIKFSIFRISGYIYQWEYYF